MSRPITEAVPGNEIGRPRRSLPESYQTTLVEVTCRTIGARALLVPAPNPRLFNEVVLGVIGRALEVAPVGLCGAVVLANHMHLLVAVEEPLPAYRHLTPEEYRDKVAELLWKIEAEGREARNGDSVAGVEKILSQNPHKPPTRRPKRSPKPLVHAEDSGVRKELRAEKRLFEAQYDEASEAYRAGNLEALSWFPAGCFPPAQPFLGAPAPPRPPSPPTRRIVVLESGEVERGGIPVVEIAARTWPAAPSSAGTRWDDEPRARGQPC